MDVTYNRINLDLDSIRLSEIIESILKIGFLSEDERRCDYYYFYKRYGKDFYTDYVITYPGKYDSFYKYLDYSIDGIIILGKLYKDFLHFNDKDLLLLEDKKRVFESLYLLVIDGRVVVNSVLGGDDTFRLVDRNKRESKYTERYENIECFSDNVLFFSDTHLKNGDFKAIDKIEGLFEYVSKTYGIDGAIHLGDVFQGVRLDKGIYAGRSLDDSEIQEILYGQIDFFKEHFPKWMKVIALEGNHDENIVKILDRCRLIFSGASVNYFKYFNDNFTMLKHKNFNDAYFIDFDGLKLSLDHHFYVNVFYPYIKTYELDENKFDSYFIGVNINDVDLSFNGHFHDDRKYDFLNSYDFTNRHFEVVPQLSNDSLDGCCAKVFRLERDSSSDIIGYSIIPIYINDNIFSSGEAEYYESRKTFLKKR